MRIGILQTGEAPDTLLPATGDYPAMFERLLAGQGFSFHIWRVMEMEFPASVNDADGWLITGSRHGAYEDLPFIKPLEAFIRDAYDAHVPLVGICFGHQIIAQALGGRVEKFAGGWTVGPTDYDFEGETFTLNAWHQDQVTEMPDAATRVATAPFCENAALVYGTRAYTIQAHPEYNDDFIGGLIRHRGKGVVPDHLMQTAEARFGTPLANAELARRIAEFFKHPRG
jgi:GMP synthase-like glutamine amidotransferase